MSPNDSFPDEFLNAAVKHGLLSPKQVESLRRETRASGGNPRELAIRKGLLSGRKLDILNAIESPLQVAPGFRIESVLGIGGFGVVFKVIQLNLDRIVALKTIRLSELGDGAAHKRFEREAKIVGQFRHPNIIAAYDYGLHDDRLFLSMEYVHGQDADQLLENQGPFDEFTAWQIIRQVSMALAYAGEQGVIHRDIKPGNLMLTEAPVGYSLPDDVPLVKVADFGLACFNENHLLNSRITVAESAVGTPFYMAPEQLVAEDVDQRADIYALGVTAWQLLSGHPPMKDDSPISIITKKTRGDDAWLDNPPAQIKTDSIALIRKMCAHDRTLRVENHPRLLTRIDHLLNSIGTRDATTSGASSESFLTPRRSDLSPESDREPGEAGPEHGFLKIDLDEAKPKAHPEFDSSDSNLFGIRSKKKWGAIGSAFFAFIALLVAIVSIPDSSHRNTDRRLEKTLVELDGPPNHLFNGMSVDPRQRGSGTWETAEGLEKGSVLAGVGTRNFECVGMSGQPLVYFRFDCGYLHHHADLITFRIMTEQNGELGHLDLFTQQAVFYQATKANAALEVERHPIRQFGEGSQGYHHVRMERHVNFWIVYVDGHSLGRLYSDDTSPAKIELVVQGPGNAHFEQIRVTPYRNPVD